MLYTFTDFLTFKELFLDYKAVSFEKRKYEVIWQRKMKWVNALKPHTPPVEGLL